jgi:hypothetical protein
MLKKAFESVGRYLLFLKKVFRRPEKWRIFFRQFVNEADKLILSSVLLVGVISLFIGGVLMGCAFMAHMEVAVIVAGFVYVAEMLSSLLQIVYFKLTHGKRLFKMAPLHHHFEKCKWSEKKIVVVFCLVTALLCAVAALIVLL